MERDEDGVLIIQGGRRYQDPGEALKTWWSGKLKLSCTERIYSNYSSKPCGKTPKHDSDARGFPTKCGHHSAAAKERKRLKSDERLAKLLREFDQKAALHKAQAEIEQALRKIAEGYNDARGLAQEVISALDGARDGSMKPNDKGDGEELQGDTR